jgi:uncharacterized protein (TIGR03067 family)
MRWLILTIPFLFIIVTGVQGGDDNAEKALADLEGLWTAKMPEPEYHGLAPRLIENPYITIVLAKDGSARINGPDNTAKVTLNPSAKPKAVDIEYTACPLKGKRQYGIYEFKKGKTKDDGIWIIVVADIGVKEADRPTDLEKAKDKSTRYVFSRGTIKSIE